MKSEIHLGFEVGTGNPVAIPLRHMAVTGQTQEAGKTTTLEALISRSGLRAIAFITKRGEGGFGTGRRILPYFRERADWEFIESILEATMKQRMKFERAWIVKACRGASTLFEVQQNVDRLKMAAKRSMDQDIFMLLGEYLHKVVPLVARLPKVAKVDLAPGLNVMDVRDYPEELQLLVISSTIRYVYEHESDVITIIPEAWKFVPQGRNTPVKVEVRKLAREGAGLKNYIWLDSQDIAGVEKEILRSASVWLLGVQREANEIKRALGSIPKGIKRPSEGDIPRLKLGQFYACWGEHVHLTYVQPGWVGDDEARLVASGKAVAQAKAPEKWNEDEMYRELYEGAQQEIVELKKRLAALESKPQHVQVTPAAVAPKSYTPQESFDNESLYQAFKKRLTEEAPAMIIALAKTTPEIELSVKREKIAMDTDTAEGKVAYLIHQGFFGMNRVSSDVADALANEGLPLDKLNALKAMQRLAEKGFLIAKEKGRYAAVEGMRVNIVRP